MNIEDQLLKEIDHLTNIIQNAERQEEQSIQFFLTLAAGSISVIGLIHNWDISVIVPTLVVLLLYGLHTLNRLNWRKITVKSSHRRMRKAFEALAIINPHFHDAIYWIDRIDDPQKKLSRIVHMVRGGQAEFMYLTNALIITGILFSLGIKWAWSCYSIIFWCTLVFIYAVIGLWCFFSSIWKRIIDGEHK